MKLPRFACACRLSELPARAEQARQLAEAEATILTALALVLALAIYYR